MNDLSRDPIINVVYNQIKKGIRVALENECYASAVILIYSGIDAMAYLDMQDGQLDVTRRDFESWADNYICFPCEEQVSGLELYGARCGMDKSVPEVCYNPAVSKNLVLVSVEGLAGAFFAGVDRFLIEAFADAEKARVAEQRLRRLVHLLPFKQDEA